MNKEFETIFERLDKPIIVLFLELDTKNMNIFQKYRKKYGKTFRCILSVLR